jgi:hypothetical protein
MKRSLDVVGALFILLGALSLMLITALRAVRR